LFAELFSCGRARKPRETPTEPADANATIGATPPTVSRETPTADDKLTADTAHNHARTPGQENDTRLLESVRNTPRPASGQRDDGVGDGDGDGEGVAVVEEKTKRGSGWVVERRVLVTTTRPNTGDAAPVAESGSAVCDATPPVRCATPEPAHEKVDTSIPMPTLKVDEAALPALEPVPVTAHLPAAQRKGPVQLLDLPPGMSLPIVLPIRELTRHRGPEAHLRTDERRGADQNVPPRRSRAGPCRDSFSPAAVLQPHTSLPPNPRRVPPHVREEHQVHHRPLGPEGASGGTGRAKGSGIHGHRRGLLRYGAH
jgi:hypothetical protein